jgi:hypothetical protein
MGIERMCALAGVSRAGYYRHWLASRPRHEETALRDAIQRLSLVERKNGYRDGYRPITIQLQRMGWAVNHKRVRGSGGKTICFACRGSRFARRRRTLGITGMSGPTWRGIWFRWRSINFGWPTSPI